MERLSTLIGQWGMKLIVPPDPSLFVSGANGSARLIAGAVPHDHAISTGAAKT
jgi:hypothetical protein